MIKTINNELERLRERNPFRVPEGYFESFTEDFMRRLPENPKQTNAKVITMYDRAKPWLYIAASFIGIVILFNIFSNTADPESTEDDSLPSAITSTENILVDEDAEFLEYIEELYVDQNTVSYIYDYFGDN